MFAAIQCNDYRVDLDIYADANKTVVIAEVPDAMTLTYVVRCGRCVHTIFCDQYGRERRENMHSIGHTTFSQNPMVSIPPMYKYVNLTYQVRIIENLEKKNHNIYCINFSTDQSVLLKICIVWIIGPLKCCPLINNIKFLFILFRGHCDNGTMQTSHFSTFFVA